MNIPANLETAKARPLVVDKPTSMKTAGVVGARGKAEWLDLRSNFNHGNFVHGQAARRLLASYKELDGRFRNPLSEKDVEELRATISHIVLVQATFLALGVTPWEQTLAGYRMLANNLELVDLPIVVLGMGVHLKAGQDVEYRVHEDLGRLLNVVAERSVGIAVRGDFTADALSRLGVNKAKVIGCQSLFWHRTPTLSHMLEGAAHKDRPTAFNFTRANIEHHLVNQAIAEDFDIIGQGASAEENLVFCNKLEGGPVAYAGFTEAAFNKKLVDREAYEAWVRKRFHQFSDADVWVQHMRRYRGAYGTRFHGNMSAYIAGVPAIWIVHDVRTQELCNHFRLPFVTMEDAKDGVDLDTLYDRMDFSECAKVYPERYQAMVDYLNAAGVNHTLLGDTSQPQGDTTLKTIQLRNDTAYNRYPWIFRAVANHLHNRPEADPAALSVLSFGCSKGDEAFALADKYFPEGKILGVDVAIDHLQMARVANQSPERVSFEISTSEVLKAKGPFDAIFAMSVLCAWPGSKGKDDITEVFSFGEFEKVLALLDANLAIGGLLAIYNANYRFSDTRFAGNYEVVPVPMMANSGFVSKFDKNCRRQPDFDEDRQMVFRKVAETSV